MSEANSKIRCGDHVLHRPTGETWVVAYADYETGDLAWSGWPEGKAALSDCERTKVASDAEHASHVAEWDAVKGDDHRSVAVRRLYMSASDG